MTARRSNHLHDRIRRRRRPTGRSHNSIVQLALVEPRLGATSIRFHQELLADATERARGEMTTGSAEEDFLSRPVHRTRWLLAHTTGTLACLATLLAFGLGLGIAQVGADSDLALAAILQAPASWT
jgi:hypothetical protein